MEIIVLIAILVAGVAVYYYNTRTNPIKPANEAPYKVEAPSVLDVNKDGEVNAQDAIAVIDKTIAAAKVVKEKTKAAAKKATAKKAPAKKTTKKK